MIGVLFSAAKTNWVRAKNFKAIGYFSLARYLSFHGREALKTGMEDKFSLLVVVVWLKFSVFCNTFQQKVTQRIIVLSFFWFQGQHASWVVCFTHILSTGDPVNGVLVKLKDFKNFFNGGLAAEKTNIFSRFSVLLLNIQPFRYMTWKR